MAMERRPLTPEELLPGAAKLAGPRVPAQMKLMAARGMTPGVAAPDLVTALYQLSFDEDDNVARAARLSLSELPESVLVGSVDKELHPLVLDRLAESAKARSRLLESLLLNSAVADETYAWLAADLPERWMEIIARNEQRLLRHPPIIEALYTNPSTRMSTANRCVELAVRNGITLNLAAFREIAQAIGMRPKEEDPIDRALAEAEMDHNFSAVAGIGDDVDPEALEAEESGDGADTRMKVEKLSVAEKIRLATLGNQFHRSILMRDANKIVAMAAIKGPGVSEMEIVRFSKNPQAPEEVLRHIANNREWVKLYQVKTNLTINPKTPLALALRLLPHLRPKELKFLSRSKNVPAALRTAAKARISKRTAGR